MNFDKGIESGVSTVLVVKKMLSEFISESVKSNVGVINELD